MLAVSGTRAVPSQSLCSRTTLRLGTARLACTALVLCLAACSEAQPGFLRLADAWIAQSNHDGALLAHAAIRNVSRAGIPIPIGGEIQIRVVIPAAAELRAFAAVTSRTRGEPGAEYILEVSICEPDGASRADRGSRVSLGNIRANAESWTRVRLEVGAFSGAEAQLCFSARRGDGEPTPGADGAVLWLADATLGTPDIARGASKQPNLLLITLDTTRGDHLSGAGYPRKTSPNLDRLARDGEQYLRAIANSSYTLPTHASLFTGLHPREHGARADADGEHMWLRGFNGLSPRHLTLAEQFWLLGYRTAGVVGGPAVGEEFGFAQGFDYYHQPSVRLLDRDTTAGAKGAPADVVIDTPDFMSGTAEEITDRAIDWLDEGNGVFFLFLNYFDPHWPYAPPVSDLPDWVKPQWKPLAAEEQTGLWQAVMSGRRELTDSERDAMIGLYDAEIRSMDRSIGRLLESLKERGLYDSTLIVVVSDHGESFGEHRMLDHGNSLFENQLRVGLIIKYPSESSAGRKGRRYEHRVDLLDLHATILREMGLLSGSDRPGSPPLLPCRFASYGLHKERPYHFAEMLENTWFTAAYGPRFRQDLEAVYHENWKLIRNDQGDRWLFDLAADPREETNLAASEPEILDELDGLLEGWAHPQDYTTPEDVPVHLSPDLIERLRELGYLGSPDDG